MGSINNIRSILISTLLVNHTYLVIIVAPLVVLDLLEPFEDFEVIEFSPEESDEFPEEDFSLDLFSTDDFDDGCSFADEDFFPL